MVKVGDVLVCTIDKGKRENEVKLSCSVVKGAPVYQEAEMYGNWGDFEGIVIDEERAKSSPCYRVNGTNLIFSKGIVGALSKEQIEKYCPTITERSPSSDVICVHLEDFDRLIKTIEQRIKEVK